MYALPDTSPLPPLLPGIGLRSPHVAEVLTERPAVGFFEVHAENYMGGAPLAELERIRRDTAISIHAVGLSIGSAEPVDKAHLERLGTLVDRIAPFAVSEHLAWSRLDGVYLNDLLPLPYTEESLGWCAANVARVQDRLSRRILIENPSTYVTFKHSTIGEAEFLAELCVRTGCGILCDVNNIHVNAVNHGIDAQRFIGSLPAAAVGEIHLAGHATREHAGRTLLIDDHGAPVAEPVWRLYERAVARFPHAAVLVEWDTNVPPLVTLLDEAETALRRRNAIQSGSARARAA